MTASDDNTAASIPGVIRDPVTATNLLRVNADGSINVTGAGSGTVTSVTAGNGINATTNPIIATGTLSAAVLQPQGRLTLLTGTPVMTSDQSAKSTVFYDSYIGNSVPIYNGTAMQPLAIGSDEISLILNATDNTNNHNYDVFAFSNSGTLAIGTGPAWTSDTGRGTGAGTTQISLQNGIWTNTVSIVLRSNGSSLGTISANQATYLGTVRTTANAQTSWICNPAAASGGSNARLYVYNAYNRVRAAASSRDSSVSWTYNSATWRVANGAGTGSGLLNRISYVDGLSQSYVRATYEQVFQSDNTNSNFPCIGILRDATTGSPDQGAGSNSFSTGQVVIGNGAPTMTYIPSLGLHFIQAMESSQNAGTATYYGQGATFAAQALLLEIEI